IDPIDGSVVFITPSPAALALGIAIAAGRAAVQARQRVSFVLPEGARLKRPVDDRLEPLFEYFEQSMIASVLVYQCLEAYSNHVISNVITESMSLKRRGKSTQMTAKELERCASTDEKLAIVLPRALGVASPKGTKVWQDYRRLKDVRDSTVHLKADDQYIRGRPDKESLYYRFLNASPMDFVLTAMAMVRHFCAASPERWLQSAERQLSDMQ